MTVTLKGIAINDVLKYSEVQFKTPDFINYAVQFSDSFSHDEKQRLRLSTQNIPVKKMMASKLKDTLISSLVRKFQNNGLSLSASDFDSQIYETELHYAFISYQISRIGSLKDCTIFTKERLPESPGKGDYNFSIVPEAIPLWLKRLFDDYLNRTVPTTIFADGTDPDSLTPFEYLKMAVGFYRSFNPDQLQDLSAVQRGKNQSLDISERCLTGAKIVTESKQSTMNLTYPLNIEADYAIINLLAEKIFVSHGLEPTAEPFIARENIIGRVLKKLNKKPVVEHPMLAISPDNILFFLQTYNIYDNFLNGVKDA